MRVVVVMECQPDLLHVVRTGGSGGGTADVLNRRQKQPEEYPDHPGHDQEFDQRDRPTWSRGHVISATERVSLPTTAQSEQ